MEWISAITALVAVILSPLISLYIVRRQFAANVLSHNRQDWIDKVREHIAQILTYIETSPVLHENSDKTNSEKTESLRLYEQRLKLLLNPNEEDHQQLLDCVAKSIRPMIAGDVSEKADIQSCSADITSYAQKILKREWERVKKGT